MTVHEEYVTTTAKTVAEEPKHSMLCQNPDMGQKCDCGYIPSTLEQRVSIALTQARALEARYWGMKLRVLATDPSARGVSAAQISLWVANQMTDRSHKLERVGLAMCEKFPPDTNTDVEVSLIGRVN